MILSTIWERYLFKEVLKVFFFFLVLFYLLYALMDYSTHMQDFTKDKQIQITDICLYYAHQFLKRASLLMPLGLMIAGIKVLTTLNTQRELLALFVSGMEFKKLFRPFLLIATLSCLFNFYNTEFLLPKSLGYLDNFHQAHFKHSFRGHRKEPIHILHLKDGSKLIYQSYDQAKDSFFDVIWISNINELWRMKYLKADPKEPVGSYIDHIKRNAEGFLEKIESFETLRFDHLKWQHESSLYKSIPIENKSMRELYKMLFITADVSSFEKPEIKTQLFFKFIMAFLSLLAIIAPAPFCIRYTRALPTFFIYSFSLFGFVTFFALMNAMLIIGENRILPPLVAIVLPFSICATFFSWRLLRCS